MSKAMKFLLVRVISWSLVAIFSISIFVNEGTIDNWGDNRTKTILLALLFLLGYGMDLTLGIVQKSKRYGFEFDERDDAISSKSMSIGFVLTLVYIFALSITLYTVYEKNGFLPIGWVWFIAYSTVFAAHLLTGIPALFLYRKRGF